MRVAFARVAFARCKKRAKILNLNIVILFENTGRALACIICLCWSARLHLPERLVVSPTRH